MVVRYILDDIAMIESPDGWQKRSSQLRYDNSLRGLLLTEDAILEWFTDGYKYIKEQFNLDLCSEIKLEIQVDEKGDGNFETDFTGTIKKPDCEFTYSPNSVKTAVVDNSFYSRINNNKGIKAKMNGNKSKNDILITPPTERVIDFFTVATGAYDYHNRVGYFIYDALKYFIDYMTDGAVGFYSESFDYSNPASPGKYANYVVMCGNELRLGLVSDQYLELSYDEIITQINKKFNIGFRLREINNKPTIQIEANENFYSDDGGIYFDNLRNLTRQIDSRKLYATIKVGSSTVELAATSPFPEQARYFGINEEQYYLYGQCNLDTELNLVSDWIVSTNVIDDVLVNNADNYDNDVFLIELTAVDNFTAKKSNWFTTPAPYYYNEGMQNKLVLQRWLEGIPRTIVAQLGLGNHRSKAIDTIGRNRFSGGSPNPGGTFAHNITEPRMFANDYSNGGNDELNQYGNGTAQGTPVSAANSRYTAAAGGVFTFEVFLPLMIYRMDGNMRWYNRITMKRYNSSNVYVEQYDNAGTYYGQNNVAGLHNWIVTHSFALDTGDYVQIEYEWSHWSSFYAANTWIETEIFPGGYFACTFASIDEGGEYDNVETKNQRFLKYKCAEIPFDYATFKKIKNNPIQPIFLSTENQGEYFKGWIDDIKFDHAAGNAVVSTLGKLND